MRIKTIGVDVSEPHQCDIMGCEEDLNAHHYIEIEVKPYHTFIIWVCYKHLKLFKLGAKE